MTKTDRDYVALTARTTARDVVEEMLIKFPCKDNAEKIQSHETVLKNGLTDEMRRIRKFLWFLLGILVTSGVIDKIFF